MKVLALAGLLVLLSAACGGGRPEAKPPSMAGTATPEAAAPADEKLAMPTAGWKTDFAEHTVPLSEFRSGGPGKDGIPAIDTPRVDSVEAAGSWLAPREPVIELDLRGQARAYPIQILVWHEIVNDDVGVPVAVTFCPLCNTALAFDRRLDGRTLSFGTTGNLRNSDLVRYDRQTESWWQQFGGEAVVGTLAGRRLRQLPARIVAWQDFTERHPGGRVLSRETGYARPLRREPAHRLRRRRLWSALPGRERG